MYLIYKPKKNLGNIPNEFLTKNGNWNYYLSNNEISEEVKLGDFKNINFFVGANNSGKSRFLRGLLKTETLVGIEISNKENDIESLLNILSEQIKKLNSNLIGRFYNLFKTISNSSYFDLTKNYIKYEQLFEQLLQELPAIEKKLKSYSVNSHQGRTSQKVFDIFHCAKEINKEILFVIENTPVEKNTFQY